VARVVYVPIAQGLSSSSDANAIFSAVATQTTNVDGDQWAEEGLDARAFESDIQSASGFTPVVHNATNTQALSTTWATLDPGGTGAFRTGAITLGSNEVLRVRFRGELLSNGSNPGLPIGCGLQIRIRRSVGGGPLAIASTVRSYFASGSEDLEARISTIASVDGPLSLDWVEVEISDQGGFSRTAQLGRCALWGTIFKRIG